MYVSGKSVHEVIKAYANPNLKAQAAAKQTTPDVKPDTVVLSPQAQEFSQLLSAVHAAPEVRLEKVALLSAQIEAGEYRVDSRKIAAKILGRPE